MCLLDTTDGALMLALYVQPAENFLASKSGSPSSAEPRTEGQDEAQNHRDPVAFLYYSIVLTSLTVIIAVVIGIIQLLTLILNVAKPTGAFWDGVQTAGDYYDVIGGSICGCFVVIGALSVLVYKPWRRWIAKRHSSREVSDEEGRRSDVLEQSNEDDTTLNEGGNHDTQRGI
jgi:high-affinity nickel-transport protein